MLEPIRLGIDSLGRRGEGISSTLEHRVYVPYALPGETVLADVDGERGHLRRILEPRPDRVTPFCQYFGRCGGCAVQSLPPDPYAAWKRELVVQALAQHGLHPPVQPLIDAHGAGRRRVTVHAAALSHEERRPPVGFMEARSHRIVDIEACPILDPGLAGALPAARRLAAALAHTGKPLDILATQTGAGLDVDLRGVGRLDDALTLRLIGLARELDLARLSNHGASLVEARAPVLRMGAAMLVLPPGAFLQATVAGEEILAGLVEAGIGRARRVADLFCGVGTFALRLASLRAVEAWDSDPRAVAALTRAAQATSGLRPIRATARDLMRRPLLADELRGFDALVFDPPRAGAVAQVAQIAAAGVPTVVAVSCDPGTFARDASVLVGAGYSIDEVTPVDQFRHSAHVELVAVFRRAMPKQRRRRLLS